MDDAVIGKILENVQKHREKKLVTKANGKTIKCV